MAKRLYFKATAEPYSSPAFGSWLDTSQAVRRRLVEAQEATTETLSGTLGGAANDEALIVQLVSPPLDGDQSILSSGTFTIISRGREVTTTDNINNRGRRIVVVSNDGQTVRGTLEALAWSASTTELSTTMSGQQHALNGGLDNTVNALDGDRIVVEYAYRETVAGTTPQWESVLGGTGTDHGTSNNDTTGTVGWVEFSQNLVFKAEANTVALGQAVETETAQAVTPFNTVVLGQPVETETAQALAVEKQVTLGFPTETETGQAVAPEKQVALGQPVETETAQAMSVAVQGASPVGDITGEDRSVTSYTTTGISGVALAGDLIEIFAIASGTAAITATGKGGAAYTVRTDVTNSSMRLVHLTRVAETAEPEATINHAVAQHGACAGQLIRSANGFDAADTTASSTTVASLALPNQTVSTPGSILLVGYGFRRSAEPVPTLKTASDHDELSESDSIQAEGNSQYAVSCSARNTGGSYGRNAGTYGGETFTTDDGVLTGRQVLIHAVVKSASGTQQHNLGQPVETETAQAITPFLAPAVSQAIETETAQPMTVEKVVLLGQAVEIETAQDMHFSGVTINVPLGQAVELETAQALTPRRDVQMGQATELETAQAITTGLQGKLKMGLYRNRVVNGVTETGSWRTKLNRDIALYDFVFDGPWSHYGAADTVLDPEVIAAYSQGHDILFFSKVGQGTAWANIGTGAADAAINSLANSIIANIDPARPIVFTWWHEPENDAAQGTPADYVSAYNRVRTRFIAQGVGTRVKWQMTYMNSDAHPNGTMESFWPGNWIQRTSQQSYIACASATNIATKHLANAQYLRDHRTAARAWSDLDNNTTDGKRMELAFSEYGMDLGGDWADCGVTISPGVVGDRGTAAHRALGFQRIQAVLQSYIDYNTVALTLFNARTDSISAESLAAQDAAAYNQLGLAINALAETPDQLHVIGGGIEAEAAQAMTVTKVVLLGQAVEFETAQPITAVGTGQPQVHVLGQAVEIESAQPMVMEISAPGPPEAIHIDPPDYTFHIEPPEYRFWLPTPDFDLEE